MQIDDSIFFESVVQKLDKIALDIAKMDKTLAVQAKDIETHIKRTDLLEIALAEAKLELVPAKNFTTFFKVGLQMLGALSLVLAIVAGLVKLTQ